jgi:hypothetical protein
MRSCEIRALRWRDINLMNLTLTIRRAKIVAGDRVIPLTPDALTAMLRLRERARLLFGDEVSQDWYVLPRSEGKTRPDPTKPMMSWRSAWRRIRGQAKIPFLRFHDLRHTAITDLAESQTSDQIIMAIAGHVSPSMLAHTAMCGWRPKGTPWTPSPRNVPHHSKLCSQKWVMAQTTAQIGEKPRQFQRGLKAAACTLRHELRQTLTELPCYQMSTCSMPLLERVSNIDDLDSPASPPLISRPLAATGMQRKYF